LFSYSLHLEKDRKEKIITNYLFLIMLTRN
jgi:hypothetical protein